MDLKSSPLVGVLAVLIIIGGAVFAFRGCGKSPAGALRQYVGDQYCLACGYEWHMDTAKMMKERLQDPTGNRFVRCPKCGKWRGVTVVRCSECGKRIPGATAYERPDGTVIVVQRRLCDECAKKAGGQPEDERGPLGVEDE
jgi:formate dehydrogenase maturation protein FdhE